ncbi:hypothetical protein ACOME3_003819 [Neoechinorhynchus agilis]
MSDWIVEHIINLILIIVMGPAYILVIIRKYVVRWLFGKAVTIAKKKVTKKIEEKKKSLIWFVLFVILGPNYIFVAIGRRIYRFIMSKFGKGSTTETTTPESTEA